MCVGGRGFAIFLRQKLGGLETGQVRGPAVGECIGSRDRVSWVRRKRKFRVEACCRKIENKGPQDFLVWWQKLT